MTLIHSHFPVRHPIRQVELYRERGPRPKTPAWLTEFVSQAAESFEPFSGVARVGFEATVSEDGVWEVAIYLGDIERIGGVDDGRQSPVNFRFRVDLLQKCFSSIDRLDWNVFPSHSELFEESSDLSFLLVEGQREGNSIRLQIQASAPDAAGPGMRHMSDGEYEVC